MPQLAGIVDLTEDPSVDLRLSSQIGSAIGGYLGHQRLKQEQSRREIGDQLVTKTLHQGRLSGKSTDQILDDLFNIPQVVDTQIEQLQAMEMYRFQQAAKREATPEYGMTPPEGLELSGASYDANGRLKPEFDRPRINKDARFQTVTGEDDIYTFDPNTGGYKASGIGRKPTTQVVVVEGPDGQPQQVLIDRATGQQIDVLGDKPQTPLYRQGGDGRYYRIDGMDSTPVSGMPAKETKPNILTGPDGSKYTFDPETNSATPISGIEAKPDTDKTSLEIARWQNVRKNSFRLTYDEFGNPIGYEVIPGQEAIIDEANRKIKELTGKQQPSESPEAKAPEAPPSPELKPYWSKLTDEDKTNVAAALANGYSVQEIIEAIKQQ